MRLFEYIKWRLTKKKRAAISAENKRQKYQKIRSAQQNGFEVCLLGDSLIEYWNLQTLNGHRCFNAGVGDANTNDVLFWLDNNLLSGSFSKFIIILGTNDVKYRMSATATIQNLTSIFKELITAFPKAEIYYYLVPHVNGRWDRKNKEIDALNAQIVPVLPQNIHQLSLDYLYDKQGNLDGRYTEDGLHFNSDAYHLVEKQLKHIIE